MGSHHSFLNSQQLDNPLSVTNVETTTDKNKRFLKRGFDQVKKAKAKGKKGKNLAPFVNNLFVSDHQGFGVYKYEGKSFKDTAKLSIKEIAELVRIEIEAEYPKKEGYKFSVRVEHGSSINVKLTEGPDNPFSVPYQLLYLDNISWDEFTRETVNYRNELPAKYNDKTQAIIKKVEAIMSRYNFDDSDSQSDYFHKRFYDSFRIEDENFIDKHYPENIERKRQRDSIAKWDQRAAARNKDAKAIREQNGNFKKGELVWFSRTSIHKSWEKYRQDNGKFLATISKSINGQSVFGSITVHLLKSTRDQDDYARYESLKADKSSYALQQLKRYWFLMNGELYTIASTTSLIAKPEELQRVSGPANALNGVTAETKNPFTTSTQNPFTTMNKLVSGGTYQLAGDIGKLLGNLGQVDCSITIKGDQGAGKSQLMWQLVDAFATAGKKVAVVSPEMNGNSPTISKYRDQYISKTNQDNILFTDKKLTVQELFNLSKEFDVVFVDSFNQLKDYKQDQFEWLSKKLPTKAIVGLFQSTTGGEMRGGNRPEFDAYVNIEVVKQDDTFKNNYALCTKNRFGGTGVKYNVSKQKIVK